MARPGGFSSDLGPPFHLSSPSPGSYGPLRPGALGGRAYAAWSIFLNIPSEAGEEVSPLFFF